MFLRRVLAATETSIVTTYYRPASIPPPLALTLAALPAEAAQRVQQTYQFAAAAHAGQERDEGTPFIEHPLRVAEILWFELGRREPDLILAALTHDILEDCPEIDAPLLEEIIGTRALAWVKAVTKPPAQGADRPVRDRTYLDHLPHLPREARLLKLADRIDNVRSVVKSPDRAKARRYLSVTRAEFIPLATATDITAARLLEAACDALEQHLN